MPAAPDNHDYAERIRERLPKRHQELRERCGLSMYALWLKCGVSRDTISRVEGGAVRRDVPPLVVLLGKEHAGHVLENRPQALRIGNPGEKSAWRRGSGMAG